MKDDIYNAIDTALINLGLEGVQFTIEHPSDLSHGDYASNAAFVAAKQANENPKDLASKIVTAIPHEALGVDRVTVEGPGFMNFYMSRNFFKEKIAEIIKKGDTWGKNEEMKGKKVLVEYTDPNPFKEFHIGHLFTNSVGESIARLFMMSGADTKRICYQGDVGLHVAQALWGIKELGFDNTSDFTPGDLGRAYAMGATAYKSKDPEVVRAIRDINRAIYDEEPEIMDVYTKGRRLSLEYFEEIYEILDTRFDDYFFESEVSEKGTSLVLEHPEIFVESEGARIFQGEKYGLHTRVFLNKEGLPTYEAKELALAKLKEERLGSYDLSILVTANEISEYFKVLMKAMSFVYPELSEKTEHLGHGTVRLSSGKMSSRTGDVIPAVAFINEVADLAAAKMDEGGKVAPSDELARDIAIGAIKFAILRGNILQNSIFDKEQALSFEGDSGPYLQYTHARITSLLEKAKKEGIELSTQKMVENVYGVERVLYMFDEVVEEALIERVPHKIAQYLLSLASEFNSFYGEEKIADPNDTFAPYKAAIAKATQITLKNGLWALGIKAPERM